MTLKNVALYVRVSTDKQSDSLKQQELDLEKYCKMNNYTIVEKYIDSGISGKNTDRPEFQRMMQDAKACKFDTVIVTKIDRFARSTIDCLTHIEKLKANNVQFMASTQPIDTSSPMGTMMLQLMSIFAEFERTLINERMKAGRARAEKEGIVCHRPRKNIPKQKLIEYVELKLSANAIAKIYDISVSSISTRLREFGYHYENGEWILK
jgi:site-specific DNA recombinase